MGRKLQDRLASLIALASHMGKAKGMLRKGADLEEIRHAAPRVLLGVACLSLLWLAYSLAWPVRLPEPDANEAMVVEPAVDVRSAMNDFVEAEKTIKAKVLFAPSTPIVARAAGGLVIEELLKKVQLAGISNVRGEQAAVIRLNGKSGLYKAGDTVGSFTVQEVSVSGVVLEVDGQQVELGR